MRENRRTRLGLQLVAPLLGREEPGRGRRGGRLLRWEGVSGGSRIAEGGRKRREVRAGRGQEEKTDLEQNPGEGNKRCRGAAPAEPPRRHRGQELRGAVGAPGAGAVAHSLGGRRARNHSETEGEGGRGGGRDAKEFEFLFALFGSASPLARLDGQLAACLIGAREPGLQLLEPLVLLGLWGVEECVRVGRGWTSRRKNGGKRSRAPGQKAPPNAAPPRSSGSCSRRRG